MINNLVDSSKFKAGDVILVCTKGLDLFSLPIRLANFFKNGYRDRGWTHAAVYVGNGDVIEALTDKGVVQRKLKEAYSDGKHSLLILRHKNASEDKLAKALQFYFQEKNARYDWNALAYFLLFSLIPPSLHFILNIGHLADRLNEKTKYFCSELISEGFLEAGAYCFEEVSYQIMPSDFNNPLLFDVVDRVNGSSSGNRFILAVKTVFFFSLYLLATVLVSLLAVIFSLLIILVLAGIVMLLIFAFASMKKKTAKKPGTSK